MTEEYHKVEFLLGLKRSAKGVVAFNVWSTKRGPELLNAGARVVKVTMEVPESLWAFPDVKGRLESTLKKEMEAFIKVVNEI